MIRPSPTDDQSAASRGFEPQEMPDAIGPREACGWEEHSLIRKLRSPPGGCDFGKQDYGSPACRQAFYFTI